MKTWQQTAQQLPVQVRPIQGETTISYIFRLADANDLARPTILLGALGRPTRGLTQFLIDDYDVRLNSLALQRLETFTGTPQGHLRTVLPGLHHPGDALPEEIPAIRVVKAWNLRDHCDHCTAPAPGPASGQDLHLVFPRTLPQTPPLARHQDGPHAYPGNHHRPPPPRPATCRHRRPPMDLPATSPRELDRQRVGTQQLSRRPPVARTLTSQRQTPHWPPQPVQPL